jgi:hypothetical protein
MPAITGIQPVPDLHVFLVFAAASLALLVFPGPAVLYIVARSVHHDPRAGLVSTVGIETGNLVHVLAGCKLTRHGFVRYVPTGGPFRGRDDGERVRRQ